MYPITCENMSLYGYDLNVSISDLSFPVRLISKPHSSTKFLFFHLWFVKTRHVENEWTFPTIQDYSARCMYRNRSNTIESESFP